MIRQLLCFALVYSAKRLLSLDVSDKLAACCVVLERDLVSTDLARLLERVLEALDLLLKAAVLELFLDLSDLLGCVVLLVVVLVSNSVFLNLDGSILVNALEKAVLFHLVNHLLKLGRLDSSLDSLGTASCKHEESHENN